MYYINAFASRFTFKQFGLRKPSFAELKKDFKRLDTNNDGMLSRAEFEPFVRSCIVFEAIGKVHRKLYRKSESHTERFSRPKNEVNNNDIINTHDSSRVKTRKKSSKRHKQSKRRLKDAQKLEKKGGTQVFKKCAADIIADDGRNYAVTTTLTTSLPSLRP